MCSSPPAKITGYHAKPGDICMSYVCKEIKDHMQINIAFWSNYMHANNTLHVAQP